MDMVDTTKTMGRGMVDIYNRYNFFAVSGYIQPQFQIIESKGAASFNGGNFDSLTDNRFSVRRGRIRMDYFRNNEKGIPKVNFVFQYDFTERGAFVRDFWGRIYDTKYNLFSLTAGLFARPFGYELNLGSSNRESPERGRMSQTLMKVERDLGAMISFEPQNKNNPLYGLKFDIGLFNGQGISTIPATDYDSKKDLISRLSLKPKKIGNKFTLSAGLSGFWGGLAGKNSVIYNMGTDSNGNASFKKDASQNYAGQIRPREYWGADFQLKYAHKWGTTELRIEYIAGQQTALQASTETPATIASIPLYSRNFEGAYIYLLQNIVNKKHQIGVKYDVYDPNTKVSGDQIGATLTSTDAGAKLSAADIKYTTLAFGYNWYIDQNIKLMLWYDIVTNENTKLAGYTNDLADNITTCRLQFRF